MEGNLVEIRRPSQSPQWGAYRGHGTLSPIGGMRRVPKPAQAGYHSIKSSRHPEVRARSMVTLSRPVEGRGALFAFLAQELAPKGGRALAVARIAAACTITVAIAMVFRIPLAAYMAYMVFLTSKDDIAATVTTAVGGMLAVTLAVLLTLGLAQVSLSEPAIRLPAMALMTFLAMFSVRTFALGPISFLAGFIVVTMQSVVDEVPNPEVFTRTTLWLWVVVVVPASITLLINVVFGPATSAVAERAFKRVLTDLEAALALGAVAGRLAQWRGILVPLIEKSRNPPAVHRFLEALVILESYPNPIPTRQREHLAYLVRGCLAATEQRLLVPEAPPEADPSPEGIAAAHTLLQVQCEIARTTTPPPDHATHKPRRLFVADAMSNPAHWQFALKTTLAIMAVYSLYSMINWPGMRTCIVTCFFVALGSLGETVHKLTLRLSGAIVGGLLAGLSIVFILPHLTDIGRLCVLTAAFSLFAGWVSTSSERLSYAGLQIAFAYFLGLLQTYSPANDLTVLRDRVAGILLGNVVMTIVFSTLWPESTIMRLRSAMADALHGIAALLRPSKRCAAIRQDTVAALWRADNFETLSRFETPILPRQAHLPDLHSIERLAGAAFVATSDPLARDVDAQAIAPLDYWLDLAAQATAEGSAFPPLAAAGIATKFGTVPQAAIAKLRMETQIVANSAR